MQVDPEKRVAELEGIIANALAALDEGRRGDVRKILKTGNDRPMIAGSGVLATGTGPGR